jgi:sugar phosphate permease
MVYPHTSPSKSPSRWFKRFEPRYQIVLACFFATFTAYVERVGFSIAFTAMAKESAVDEAVKGTVLSAFYWGYGVSQVGVSPTVLLF